MELSKPPPYPPSNMQPATVQVVECLGCPSAVPVAVQTASEIAAVAESKPRTLITNASCPVALKQTNEHASIDAVNLMDI